MREWYVYVPESVKAQPEKPVPLVFALHGYTCAGEIYAGNSEWYKAADQHGFLVVHPTATPGQMEMENQVCSIQNVPLPALPADENDTGTSIRVWQRGNHLAPSFPASWDEGWEGQRALA